MPRSFRITQEHFAKVTYTKGCPTCEALRRGDGHRTVHHSSECRKIIETEMNKDEALSMTLIDIEESNRDFFARQVEASDKEWLKANTGAADDSHDSVESPEATADNLTSCAPAEVMMVRSSTPESRVCTWIECA